MTVAKTPIASPTSKLTQKGWTITMDAGADEIIFDVDKYDQFALQVKGITDDEIQALFTNEDTTPTFHQWKSATAVNPWTQDDLAGDFIRYRQMKILRVGGADGTITLILWFK